MPTTTCSQANHHQDTVSADMNARLAETEQKLKQVTTIVEDLWWENEDLRYCNAKLSNATLPSNNKQLEGEAKSAS